MKNPENEQNLANEDLNFQTNSHAAGCFSIADMTVTTNFLKIACGAPKPKIHNKNTWKTLKITNWPWKSWNLASKNSENDGKKTRNMFGGPERPRKSASKKLKMVVTLTNRPECEPWKPWKWTPNLENLEKTLKFGFCPQKPWKWAFPSQKVQNFRLRRAHLSIDRGGWQTLKNPEFENFPINKP